MMQRGLLACALLGFTLWAQQDPIHVVILEGDGAINSIRSAHAKEPIVRVEDQENRGVPGAVVTFLAPTTGPGALFGESGTSLTVTTDDRGEVMARGLRSNHNPGTFQIRVSASSKGRTATAAINQTNVDPGAHGSSRKIAILALIGGAAAGGAFAAMHGGKSKTSTAAIPSGTVVVSGTPSLGPP